MCVCVGGGWEWEKRIKNSFLFPCMECNLFFFFKERESVRVRGWGGQREQGWGGQREWEKDS